MENRLPLALPRGSGNLFRGVVDPQFVVPWLQRELPSLATCPIRVTAARAVSSRTSLQHSRLRIVYGVSLEGPRGEAWEHTLVGVVPSDRSFLSPELLARCAETRNHPGAVPFHRLAAYIDELQMGLLILPLDLDLPAFAEVTGAGGPRILEPLLPECKAGVSITHADWTLRRYKPAMSCVLRFEVTLASARRAIFVKVFRDDRGRELHENMQSVWDAASRCSCLRVPQPLGYDAGRRMLVMSEVPGERTLCDWIKCLEKERPLPPGVDEARLDRCMAVAAQALADLQGAGVRPRRRRMLRDDLAGWRRRVGLLRAGHPQLSREIETLLSRLEAEALDDGAMVPAHGGFRHKQMIGEDRCLTILDWDGLCLAHPALDAATFLARLRREPISAPGGAPRLERLAEVFRDEFLGRSRVRRRELAACEAVVLADLAMRALRRTGRGAQTAVRVRGLLAASHQLLDGAAR